MKKFVVFIVAPLIFCLCAVIGYSIASQNDFLDLGKTVEPVDSEGGEQYNVLIIQVDQLDGLKPRLVSVWYVSLFFMDDSPPTLTFGQLFAPYSGTESAQRLARAFALTAGGEPASGFLRAVESFKIRWDAYFVVDYFSTQRMLEWVNGPGEFTRPFDDPQQTRALLEQTCQSLAGLSTRQAPLSNRQVPPFDWTGLAPHHFHSNLRMEIGLDYWNRMNSTEEPVRCEIILTP